ncbi:hypothetical protein MBLNU459_g4841t2 [Dothideomycetes sp. NU459]
MFGSLEEFPSELAVMKRRQDSMSQSHSMRSPLSNGTLHQHIDGYQSFSQPSIINGDMVTIIRDTILDKRGRIIAEFDNIDAALLDSMTLEGFSDWIARERLSSMPHRGSTWDRVLQWAEFYALQIFSYAKVIGPFVPESRTASKQIFTLLRSLLELGENNAAALNTTFGVFYKLGLSLSFLSSHEAKLSLSTHIREDVGRAFHDIHTLVFDVAVYYQRSVRGLSRGTVTVDFISLFRGNLENFYRRKSLIIDHMWRHSLGTKASKDVQKMRAWLDQRSCLLKVVSADRLAYKLQYDQYTCEWFQRHLLDFTRSNQDVLAITAPSGGGKTVLSSWIQERLQRPLDQKTHSTIMYKFEADIPREATSLALAKSLALQMLDLHVGNAKMFELIAEAYSQNDIKAVEARLWKALDAAFSGPSEPTVIIVDGLDKLKGGDITDVCDRISKLSNNHRSLKSILLSTPNAALPVSNQQWRIFDVKADYVHEDMHHIAKHALRSCEQFMIQKQPERQAIIERLVKTANGSFLWLVLTVNVLRTCKSIEDFEKNVKDAPKPLDETIKIYANSIDYSDADTRLILSLLLVAERPLTTHELYDVLQVDLSKKMNTHRPIDLGKKIARMNGLLHINEAEVVKFRQNAIRAFFMTMQFKGEKIMALKDSQTEMTQRLLAYSKACLTTKHDVCLETLAHADVEHVYKEHHLLEYAVRNWTTHFVHSPLFKPTGHFDLSPDFKALFPASPYMALLEWTCWEEQASRHELVNMHDLSLRVRSEVFTEKNVCSLQNVITCGFVHQEYSSTTSAAQYFLRASRIGQAILPKYSKVTLTCTTIFLTLTNMIEFTSRNETVTYREEMLRFIITAYKHEHGETSDIVIQYLKVLAELFVSIHEEERAAECWKELRGIIVKKHGEGSEAEREISGKLMVVLKGKDEFEIEQYRGDIFAIGEESVIVWDVARITMFLELALGCEHRKEFYEAEEIYVTLWTRLLHLCKDQRSNDIDFRIGVLRVAIAYAHFLQRQSRHEEVKNVLIVIWTEYQHFGCDSTAFYLQLKVIGQLMRDVGLLVLSVSVFEKVVQWFRAVGKHDHHEVHDCEGLIVEIVGEITRKETFRKDETTEGIDIIMRRMFSSTTVVTKEYIKITRAAVQLYIRKEQWTEAITVLTKALALMWTESSWGGEICLPNEFVDEAIEFAIELGKCYMECKHYQESLSCYLQLWQAVRSSCGFKDKRRKVIVDALIGFYTEHRRWKLLIELYKDLLVDYRRHLGKTHEDTITVLYLLGDLVLEHGHGHAEDYFREIVEVLGTSNFKSSFKAYRMLCQIHYDESQWTELKVVCDVLWNQLVHHHKEHNFDADFVEMLYIRYIYVLRHHHQSDHKLLVSIASQYKEVCVLMFGTTSPIAVRARMEYASVLMESDSTKTDAISIYEEILTISKTSKTVIDKSLLAILKKHLTDAYMHAHAHGSATPEMIQRAIAVLQERYEHLSLTLGCAHKETLKIFQELMMLHFKLKSSDHEAVITQKLRAIVVELITKEQRSQVLFEAATTIGAIYIACSLHSHGLELMREIRRQVISDHTHGSKETVKIGKSVGRISFAFLVAFELTLKGSVTHSYSEIMADWLTESVLHENYTRCLSNQAKIEVVLMRSAHLRSFWALRGRKEEITLLDQQVFDIFFKRYGNVVGTRAEMVKVFLVSILVQLGSRETYNIQIARVASIAGNNKVLELLQAGRYQEAHEVAHCTFRFVMSQGGYHKAGLIGFGFKLAGYMAGREAEQMPAEVRGKMLQTSREIIAEVLHACKDLQINFLQLPDHEINDLVELLGEQENYKELEIILESLWKSRHGQKHWSEDTIINLGLRLIDSRHLAAKDGHSHGAIHLAEDINYNIRRVLGGLNAHTLEISTKLSQLYTNAKQYGDAINVHEGILQLIVSGDDGDPRTDDSVTAEVARNHLNLLKAAYQRNEGWDKSAKTYKSLIDELLSMRKYRADSHFRDVQPVQKWVAKPDESTGRLGLYVKPQRWGFIMENGRVVEVGDGVQTNGTHKGAKMLMDPITEKESGWSLRRISENWGMSFGGKEARPTNRPSIVY